MRKDLITVVYETVLVGCLLMCADTFWREFALRGHQHNIKRVIQLSSPSFRAANLTCDPYQPFWLLILVSHPQTDEGPRFLKELNPSFIWGLMSLTGFRKMVSLLFCYLLMHIFCWTRNPILSPVFFAGSLASRDWNCWSKLRLFLLCAFFAGTFYSTV